VTVTVKLFASFRTGRFDAKTADYPAGATVADVVGSLALPRAEVGIILINSRHAELDRPLADGDTLALFPLLGGG
jgi:molybdopterin converting factor small subunit